MNTAFAPADTLHLTNLTKVFWPEHGYTKRDLLDYYRPIAPVMLPYLQDRPQVPHRHVDGRAGKEFFQRVCRKCPAWSRWHESPSSAASSAISICATTGPRSFGSPTSAA